MFKRMLKRIGVIAALVAAALVLVVVSAVPANAVRQIVGNGDCADWGMTVLTRDGKGKHYKIAPGKTVNMKNGKRQIWVPSKTRVYKQYNLNTKSCPSGAWRVATGSGYWADFGWRGATIVFSYCPLNSKPACEVR